MAGKNGGKREGAGRKSKAEELGLPALIDEVLGKNGKKDLIEAINKEAKSGSFQHQQLLMAYSYGKPKETKELKVTKDVIVDYPTSED